MKCQNCNRTATVHITEVLPEDDFEEFHFCEECAQKYIYQSQADPSESSTGIPAEESYSSALLGQQCPVCGIKFMEFRNTGRLGCAHDYEQFREDLLPLLENIHGDTKHCGKIPRRLPQDKHAQSELIELRKQLEQAIREEAYEQAASLRDRIRHLEESHGATEPLT